jgi:hypothetical protein
MIGRLEPAIGSALRVGPVMEAAVGERTAQALMKEEEKRNNRATSTPFVVRR